MATQFFYTLSFIAILVAIILVMMYLLCVDEYYRVSVLKWTGIDLIVAGELNQVMDISPILLQLLSDLKGRFFKELLTTLQYMMNIKLSQQRVWHCHENGLAKSLARIPNHMYLCESQLLKFPFTEDYG